MFIIISLLLISAGCIENTSESNKLTAKKAFDISKTHFKNNYNKTILETVGADTEINEEGKAEGWSFSYVYELENDSYKVLSVRVKGDSINEVEVFGYINKSERKIKLLSNWTIDSDEAMDIAKENQKISGYLDEYDDAEVDQMQLDMWKDYSKDDAVWIISWMHNAGMDNPKNARAIVNAHTGEVIEAEADN